MHTQNTAGPRLAVTILMPAFNTSRYIDQAITSVLGQTRGDFELVVVDDGSTDDTAAIVAAYTRRDSRIRLIRQSNQGIGGARNTALAHARAPWVALLDSDDFWFPTYLAEQLAILERQPEIDILSANAINIGGVWDGLVYNRRAQGGEPFELSMLDLIREEDSVCILTLVRRSLLTALDGFDARLRGSEDYDLWLRALAAGHRVFFNPTPLAGYRRRPDSVSADEIRMLDAIVVPLRALRARARNDAAVNEAIDGQLARFTVRREMVLAREALERGERSRLAERLRALHHHTGQWRYGAGSLICRVAPGALEWLYRGRVMLRGLGRSRRRAGPAYGAERSAPAAGERSVTVSGRVDRVS